MRVAVLIETVLWSDQSFREVGENGWLATMNPERKHLGRRAGKQCLWTVPG